MTRPVRNHITRVASPLVVVTSLLLAGCGSSASSEKRESAAPSEGASSTVMRFYAAIGRADGAAACELLSSAGQSQAVALFSTVEPDAGVEDCSTALGVKIRTAGIEQQFHGEDFGPSLLTTVDQAEATGNLSTDAQGSTATVTINGASELWRSLTLKRFGNAWRIESFVLPSAIG